MMMPPALGSRKYAQIRTFLKAAEAFLHVVKMVDGVVDQISGERLDREASAVAPATRPFPRVALDGVETLRERSGICRQLSLHPLRIFLGVPLLDRGRVLVPVVVKRILFIKHAAKTFVIERVHIANVTRVLEC